MPTAHKSKSVSATTIFILGFIMILVGVGFFFVGIDASNRARDERQTKIVTNQAKIVTNQAHGTRQVFKNCVAQHDFYEVLVTQFGALSNVDNSIVKTLKAENPNNPTLALVEKRAWHEHVIAEASENSLANDCSFPYTPVR